MTESAVESACAEAPAPPESQPHSSGPRRRWRVPLLGVALFAATVGAVSSTTTFAVGWMETPQFCGGCHTMQPERLAHAQSPHRNVDCAACHIRPGVDGFLEAKLNGTKQLLELVTSSYQRPIPPAGHVMSRDETSQSCVECHRGGPAQRDRLVVSHEFLDDEANTEQSVSLVLRLSDGSARGNSRGIHWHVASQVDFLPRDTLERQIDYVHVTSPSGETKEFVSDEIGGQLYGQYAEDVLRQTRGAEGLTRMTCISCHNRVGHDFVAPDEAVDEALETGAIDRALPYVKREAIDLLTRPYASSESARQAMVGLEDFYRGGFPGVYQAKQAQIGEAVVALEQIYSRAYSPEMNANFADYPSFLGHRDSEGCFRCHDGQHRLLDSAGKPTSTVIPSTCSTCHTPPQAGSSARFESMLQQASADHATASLFGHAADIRSVGGDTSACAACHQASSCARCHGGYDVLSGAPAVPAPRIQTSLSAPARS